MTEQRRNLVIYGLLAGIVAACLAFLGNPKNMAICIACFIRDIAGSMKFHTAPIVQYFRPEIGGMILGSFIISKATGEFKSTAGSSVGIRFFLGMIMMIGALIFLGCPTRMVLRMASGEIAAWIGLIGFALGVAAGSFFLKKGFSLGRNHESSEVGALALPVVLIALLIMAATTNWFVTSEKGPGSIHAPFIFSLVLALIFGIIGQRSRMCFAGAIRDIYLLKNFDLSILIAGIFIVMTIFNLATGNFKVVAFGPIGHAQTIWNIVGLFIVGFAGVLLGGCPFRQLILAGSGSQDSAVTVLGMFLGAALAHNFSLASSGAALATATEAAKIGGPSLSGKVAGVVCIIVLFIVAYLGSNKKKI